jgi:hypothetical protein
MFRLFDIIKRFYERDDYQMTNYFFNLILCIYSFLVICDCAVSEDWRNIKHGFEIPTKTYADQPYIVKTDDGAWLCIMTTGHGHEGASGQHVVSLRSTDMGKTWSEPVALEPSDGPEASYAVVLKAPYGRIYAFYNHNTDNIRQVKADNPPYRDGYCKRVDSLGYYVFKYSDDHGHSWSDERYTIPVREFEIDRNNAYQGKIRFFWNVGKPFIHDSIGYVPHHKVGGFGRGFFTRNEGVLLKSPNILTERDPHKIEWETLPDGDIGLRTPPGGGPISAEQSFSVLSDGSFYCVYRSVDGHPVYTYSRDGGHHWDVPQYKRYADGRLMKHPRAANFAWKCSNGNYLYWFHNHGGKSYDDRNPVWMCGGIEVDSPQGRIIQWSQPEIVLYDDDPFIRISYPDLIEDNGRYFLTETQKDIARVHDIPAAFLEQLWNQFGNHKVSQNGLILEIQSKNNEFPTTIPIPRLPDFVVRDGNRPDYGSKNTNQGFTIDLWVKFHTLSKDQIILDNRTKTGQGFCLQTKSGNAVEICINDGRTENRWVSDSNTIQINKNHHIVVSVDGGAKIIRFIIDGKLCDGGTLRQFGWGRFNPNLRTINGNTQIKIAHNLKGEIQQLRLYERHLLTSEAIGNYLSDVSSADF